jgi:hypothetical protein
MYSMVRTLRAAPSNYGCSGQHHAAAEPQLQHLLTSITHNRTYLFNRQIRPGAGVAPSIFHLTEIEQLL